MIELGIILNPVSTQEYQKEANKIVWNVLH